MGVMVVMSSDRRVVSEGDSPLIGELAAIVGDANILTGDADRTFFSTDIAASGATAAVVVRVSSTDQVSQVVGRAVAHNMAVVPRGGGFSYTGGYTPVSEDTVIIDLRGVDQIVEINAQDMYVRVGVGCTWRQLYLALKAQGLRTPYFGPMSGYSATVGGALSQGSFFLGSTEHGTTADSVLSLEVVLGDGAVIHTGSDSGGADIGPFYRNYGPDLTGLFLADTGAMGFKTIATLKLLKTPPAQAYGTFAFADGQDALNALSEIGRSGLAAEAFVWDPHFVAHMRKRAHGTGQNVRYLWNAVRNSAGIIDGVSSAVRMAMSGKRVFKRDVHLMQVMIDDHSAAGAAERLKQVRAITRRFNSQEMEPSYPRVLRGTPFNPINLPELRTTQRHLPVNSLYPHSRVAAALAAILALLESETEAMKTHEVNVGVILFAVGRHAMCIEPVLDWPDEEHFLHDRVTEASDVAGLARFRERPAATTYALALRERLQTVMKAHGAVHVQIGKAYDYLPSREPRIARLVRDIKRAVDPQGKINPGSLGL